MNKRSKRSWISKSGFGFAALLLGVVAVGCSGCDAADGMLALAKTTATQAVSEAVGGVIGGAVDSIIGGVIPGSDGA